jgi:hypothetical protein
MSLNGRSFSYPQLGATSAADSAEDNALARLLRSTDKRPRVLHRSEGHNLGITLHFDVANIGAFISVSFHT